MPLVDRDIIITPNRGASSEPSIAFRGADTATSATVTLKVYNSSTVGTVSFEGAVGQLMTIVDSMAGTIFSANDISGIPSIEVLDTGEVRLAQYNGFVNILGTLTSTSTSTGVLRVFGGVGINGNINIGGTANIAGITTVTNTTNATSTATGAFQVRGGMSIGSNLFVGSGVNIAGLTTVTNTTNATSTATGALQVRGGIGVAQDIWIGGIVEAAGTTNATSTTTGALQVVGGAGIGGNLYVGGTVVGGGVRTSSTSTAPTNPIVGDVWYNTSNDVIYRFTNDGYSSYWIDVSSPTFAIGLSPAATLAGVETLTNKTLTNPTITNYTESVVTIGTVSTSHTLSITNGTVQTATLTASTACTFTMPTATAGKSFVLYLKQAATTGNGTATFTGVKWPTAGAPTITATAGKMDILSFVSDGTNWYGSYTQGYTP